VAVANGDRFIVHLPSPSITVGGGVVVDAHPRYAYRRRAGAADKSVLARLEAMLQGTPAQRLEKALLQLGFTTRAECAKQAGLDDAEVSAALAELSAEGAIVQVDEVVAGRGLWQSKLELAVKITTAFHKAQPLVVGMQRESLRNKLGLVPRAFNALIRHGADAGALVDDGETVRTPAHQIRFTSAQQQDVDGLMAEFRARPFNTPAVKDCRTAVSDAVYEALLRQRRLVQVKPDVVFLAETYAAAVAQVREIIQRDGSVTAALMRDALGTSRKYALGLLEHLDEIGVTKRVGDARVLK
jgi:selenocysteine-specific elongation factor